MRTFGFSRCGIEPLHVAPPREPREDRKRASPQTWAPRPRLASHVMTLHAKHSRRARSPITSTHSPVGWPPRKPRAQAPGFKFQARPSGACARRARRRPMCPWSLTPQARPQVESRTPLPGLFRDNWAIPPLEAPGNTSFRAQARSNADTYQRPRHSRCAIPRTNRARRAQKCRTRRSKTAR